MLRNHTNRESLIFYLSKAAMGISAVLFAKVCFDLLNHAVNDTRNINARIEVGYSFISGSLSLIASGFFFSRHPTAPARPANDVNSYQAFKPGTMD
jgi:hypothetical protein